MHAILSRCTMKWSWHFPIPESAEFFASVQSTNVGISYLPRFMQLFQETYPQVHAGPYTDDRTDGSHALKWGARSFAIVGGTIHSEQITLTPLFQEHYTAICAPGQPDGRKTVSINAFMKEPLLFREVSSTSYEVFQNAIRRTGCEVTPAWESTSQEAILEAVRRGLASRFFKAL